MHLKLPIHYGQSDCFNQVLLTGFSINILSILSQPTPLAEAPCSIKIHQQPDPQISPPLSDHQHSPTICPANPNNPSSLCHPTPAHISGRSLLLHQRPGQLPELRPPNWMEIPCLTIAHLGQQKSSPQLEQKTFYSTTGNSSQKTREEMEPKEQNIYPTRQTQKSTTIPIILPK